MDKEENLFPVYYSGKEYYEKDCNAVFLAFYDCKEALNWANGVYVSEGIYVYPDGAMKHC